MSPKPKREPLDATRFVRSPNLDVRGTVALSIKLLGLLPASKSEKDEPLIARVRGAARELRQDALALQSAWAVRDSQQEPKLRPHDLVFDSAWSALLGRLEPWLSLADEADYAADAARAGELIQELFPTGPDVTQLGFTRLELNAQWVEGDRRMKRIESAGLRADLARLAGEPFVLRLERAHAALGRALGLDGKPADGAAKPTVDLAVGMRKVQLSISAYALELVSVYRTASDELAGKITGALAPIEEFRAMARPTAVVSQPAAPPTEPEVPPVGPETPIPPVAEG